MSNSNQRIIAISIVAIIALLGVTGYLLYSKVTQEKLIKQQNSELIATEKLQAELEKEYYQSLSDLEEMRSTNEELNTLIDSQKGELKTQKDRISTLLKSEKDLEYARAELRKMKSMSEQYVAEISELQTANEKLTKDNTELQQQTQILTQTVEEAQATNEELTMARASLVSQKENLESERAALARKVDIASVLQVRDVSVNGYRLRSNGKEVEKKAAKAVEGLKICFSTLANVIALEGTERFHVRIIDPLGETLAIDDLGSGVITNPSTMQQVRYTQYRDIDYTQEPTDMCMNWQPGLPFNPGNYTVEVYNKGYLAGTSTFTLK